MSLQGVSSSMWRNYSRFLLLALAIGGSHLLTRAGTVLATPAADRPAERPRPAEAPPREPESITVHGRVLSPDGKPMADVGIYLGRGPRVSVPSARRTLSGA